MLSLFVLINNYFHDLATGLFFAAGVLILCSERVLARHDNIWAKRFYLELFRKFTWLGGLALTAVLLAGIPRAVFYREFEWYPALGKGIMAALAVKHILLFCVVATGGRLWYLLYKKAMLLEAEIKKGTKPLNPSAFSPKTEIGG